VGNHEVAGAKQHPVVMVTNDLTYQVAADAIEQKASVIVSYRKPLIQSAHKTFII
jgi:hypothetical protein